MATVGERVAAMEVELREVRADVRSAYVLLHGGDGIEYKDSVRGRLHRIEATLAAMVLRRNLGVGLLKGWERVALVLCAVATAGAAWWSVLAH